mgnify:CR=1 FL=1
MQSKITTVVLTVTLVVSLILNIGFYFQIRGLEEMNRNSARQIQELFQTLSDMVFSVYYQDIQVAGQRWIEVHGSPPEGVEVKPCYINTDDVAAWIDSAGNLQLIREGVYGPRWPRGLYWDGFPYPDWCRPPEVIAIWVQLYNRSSGLWFSETEVLSRKSGDFTCYLINSSAHKVIGIDAYYAIHLEQDFKNNSLPKILPNIIGTPNFLLRPRSYGMCNDGSWDWKYEVMLKDVEWYYAYDLVLIVDWNTETAGIKMLKPK